MAAYQSILWQARDSPKTLSPFPFGNRTNCSLCSISDTFQVPIWIINKSAFAVMDVSDASVLIFYRKRTWKIIVDIFNGSPLQLFVCRYAYFRVNRKPYHLLEKSLMCQRISRYAMRSLLCLNSAKEKIRTTAANFSSSISLPADTQFRRIILHMPV